MKILFFTPHPFDDPSSRLRVYQYLDELKKKDVKFNLFSFTDAKLFTVLLKRGPLSLFILCRVLFCYLKRFLLIFTSIRYDIIFIHRELSPLWGSFLDIILLALGKKVVYDFDDAVHKLPTHIRRISSKLRGKSSPEFWCKNAKAVIAGNGFLKEYAEKYSENVFLIPTAVHIERYSEVAAHQRSKKSTDNITIGWIGTPDTFFYLSNLEEVLSRLVGSYNLSILIVGSDKGDLKGSDTKRYRWSYDKETEYLSEFDIGLYPLADDEYSKGKSGYKAILYMASGIPCVASPIGVNMDIIEDGENGFLASNPDEWEKKLSLLIENTDLRDKIRDNGLKTVEERYSKSIVFEKLFSVFEKINSQ